MRQNYPMKRSLLLPLLVVAVWVVSSCTSTRYVSDSLKSYAPTDIPLIEPYTHVYHIERGNKAAYSDSLSYLAHETLLDCLEENSAWFPYEKILYLDDKDVWLDLAGDMDMFLAHCRDSRRSEIASWPLPASLAEFMAANNLPYAMMLYHSGMMRSAKNFNSAVAANVAVTVGTVALSVLTGGLTPVVYGTSHRVMSKFIVVVANATEGRVSYYNMAEDAYDPLDRTQDYELLKRVFRKYPSKKM